MNKVRSDEYDYINFLIAAQKSYSCLEAGKVQPDEVGSPSHDSLTRLLHREVPSTSKLWKEAKSQVKRTTGLLILDDTTLDKPYAKKMELVKRQWSGKHHQTVLGINLLTLLWSDGDRHIPCDYRIYDKINDGLGKNEHFRMLLDVANQRGFMPECVCFDSWYSSLENLKHIRGHHWHWFTRLKPNRLVNADGNGNVAIARVEIGCEGRIVHLKYYGFIKVFKTVSTNGDVEYWATSNLNMTVIGRLSTSEKVWTIENYHRGLKQFCGVEKCQCRSATAQRNHIGCSIRAFLRLEVYSFASGHSWFEAKSQIIRHAIRAYLQNPLYILHSTA